MKILIVSINSKHIHSSLAPWYLKSAFDCVSNNNDTLEIYEATINNSYSDVIKDIQSYNADVIGFSTYIWNIEYILDIISSIRQICNATIFLGGMEATFNCDELIKNKDIDFIIKHEGEEIIKQLYNNSFIINDSINNLVYRDNDKIVYTDIISSTNYYNPYTKEYFNKLNNRIAYIETNRGCPFSCAFCLSGRNDNIRFFNLDEAKANILALANSGSKTIKFIDRTFNCNENRSLELMEYILELYNDNRIDKDVVFHCEVGADLFTSKSLEFFKKLPVGLFQFEAGLQSFNPTTLKAINRNMSIDKLVSNLKAIKSNMNIHLHIDLIAGLPYEDYESFKEGFNLAYEINADQIQLGFLKLLKGSMLERLKDKYEYKYSKYAPYQVLCNKYISYEELCELEIVEDCVDRIINSKKYYNSFKYVSEVLGISVYDNLLGFAKYRERYEKFISQEIYAKIIYEYYSSFDSIDNDKLRDLLCLDKMITDKFGRVYNFLHKEDNLLSKFRFYLKHNTYLDKDYHLLLKKGLLGVFISYYNNKLVVVDYSSYNAAIEVYDYNEYDINDVLSIIDK